MRNDDPVTRYGPPLAGVILAVVVSVLAILSMAAVALGVGNWFDLDIGTVAGAFSGAGTATAALGAVQQQLAAGGPIPPEPAIGYAVAYPITVLLTILSCSYLIRAGNRKPTAEDQVFVGSLMKPVTEPGRFASWIAAPPRGINGQPLEFEYVRLG